MWAGESVLKPCPALWHGVLVHEPSETHMNLDDFNAVELGDLRKVRAFNLNFHFKKEHGIIVNKKDSVNYCL